MRIKFMALREYEKEKGVIENACGCRNENFILKAVNNHKLQTIEDKKAWNREYEQNQTLSKKTYYYSFPFPRQRRPF